MSNLRNKKVLITREKSQAKSLSSLIKKYNGIPIIVPLISIECLKTDHFDVKQKPYEWIFFTSVNGVHCFMKQYNVSLVQYKIAAVGHKTAQIIENYGYNVHFIPSTYNAETMVEEFLHKYPNSNHILIIRGNLSRNVLLEALREANLSFDPIVVYETKPNLQMKEILIETLKRERPDYLTFTSPSTVNTFINLLEETEIINEILQIPTVCIGSTTENAAKSLHFSTLITPDTFTIEAMVDELVKFENNRFSSD